MFTFPHSPCYSTELQPCQRVPFHWSGNSPQRSRWCQACCPGEEIIHQYLWKGLVIVQLIFVCVYRAQRRFGGTWWAYSIQRNDGVLKKGLHDHSKVLSVIVMASIRHFFRFNLKERAQLLTENDRIHEKANAFTSEVSHSYYTERSTLMYVCCLHIL